MAAFLELQHAKPELALFLSLVAGQFIGRIKIKEFSFGSVVGTLIAGIIIGIPAKPEYPDLAGYPVTYAIANVLLTVAGPVVVAVLYAWNN